ASPEHALSFKCFFAGVIGEGEETFIEILRCIEKKRDWTNIDGIAYMDSLGNLIRTKPRKLIDNLDLIPFPAYDLIPNMFAYTPQAYNYKKTPVANIMTSRGCPNQCTFCDRTIFGQKLRQRSPDNVAQEISLLYHKYAIKEFAFADDTFTINFDRVIKLFDILEKDNISFPWTCMSRVNTVTKESIKQMKKLGCWMLSFGIESGVEDILKTIKKNITLEQIHQALLWCKEEGIKSAGFFMIGHPQETLETINKTIAFALKLPLNVVSVTINTPYPGSAQHQDVNKYGLLDSTDWSLYSHWRPVFIPFGLDKETLVNKQKEFYRRFYLRPAIIFSFMLTFFKSGGFKRFFQLVKSVPYILFK
ncbi:MAG: B12-binding domain-containing radical SAM protein, partial [Elusimicrobiota bacterium]|nr:B12-binding domain-containing radical SAM protein [Elusimicrobiota bacterium]